MLTHTHSAITWGEVKCLWISQFLGEVKIDLFRVLRRYEDAIVNALNAIFSWPLLRGRTYKLKIWALMIIINRFAEWWGDGVVDEWCSSSQFHFYLCFSCLCLSVLLRLHGPYFIVHILFYSQTAAFIGEFRSRSVHTHTPFLDTWTFGLIFACKSDFSNANIMQYALNASDGLFLFETL